MISIDGESMSLHNSARQAEAAVGVPPAMGVDEIGEGN